MRRSKLEMYVDTLKVLAHQGPLKLTHLMYKTNVNCCVLKEYLEFLIKQELVEEKTIGKHRIVYTITQKGITVLKHFKELKQVLPIEEEHQRSAPPLFKFPIYSVSNTEKQSLQSRSQRGSLS
jgi:predicted transcriptional regulator